MTSRSLIIDEDQIQFNDANDNMITSILCNDNGIIISPSDSKDTTIDGNLIVNGDITTNNIAEFEITVPDNTQTQDSIGNIPAGTTASTLKSLSLNQLITSMLFEDVTPTVSNSGSISFSSYNAARTAIYPGTAVNTFNCTMNQGSWSNGNPYRGVATTGTATLTEQSSLSLSYTNNVANVNFGSPVYTTLGTKTLVITCVCEAGDTQTTSLGNTFNNNFGAANTFSKNTKIEVVIPVYYGNSTTESSNFRTWSNWSWQAFTLPAGADQYFEVPEDLTTSPKIYEQNPFTGAYEDKTSGYTEITGYTRTFNGYTFNYRRYTVAGNRGDYPTRLYD